MAYKILICFSLIFIVAFVSYRKKINIEKDIIIGFFRASVQVLLLSFIILKLFQMEQFYVFAALVAMGFAGVITADQHGKFFKKSFIISAAGLYISSFLTIFFMLSLKVIENKAAVVLPLGGMVIGNAMNSISLAYDRLKGEIEHDLPYIETMLSLGFSSDVAFSRAKSKSIRAAMIPKLNNMKSLGLVWIPGLMAGMILGGASPVKAAIYQLIIIVMIVVSSFIASYLVVVLAKSKIFNKYEQVILF